MDDNAQGNVQHIQEHGVTPSEAEEVLLDPSSDTTASRSSGNRITFGYTAARRYLAVVWEHVLDDPLTIYPLTAYEAPEPRSRKRKKR